MNTGSADTRSPHLSLEQLIDEVTGQAMGGRAREHLATCEHCRVEVNRWDLVADSVRALAADAPEVAQPARLLRTGPHVPAGRGRRTRLAASAAAALVLVGGVGFAMASLTGHAPARTAAGTSPGTRAGSAANALTAVSGCAGLKQAEGALERVNGGGLVIKTPSGQSVNVTTNASTMATISSAPLSDITDGAKVTVIGLSSGGTVAASSVGVGSPFKTPVSGTPVFKLLPDMTGVYGTAADVSPAGFTVVTSSGTRVPVTISGDTGVHVFHASLSQLQAGASTIAAGYVQADGTLSATVVIQPPAGSAGKGQGQLQLDLGGCTPASIDQAYTSAFGSGS